MLTQTLVVPAKEPLGTAAIVDDETTAAPRRQETREQAFFEGRADVAAAAERERTERARAKTFMSAKAVRPLSATSRPSGGRGFTAIKGSTPCNCLCTGH